MKQLKSYWAVEHCENYSILFVETPDRSQFRTVKGPFLSLNKAKTQIKQWFAEERLELSRRLEDVRALTAEDVKNNSEKVL